MKQLRKYIKVVAAFLLVNTVYYIMGPTAAMALTAGPTAPEYSSFEPVDTTDMVNLSSGDMVYNVPLLEVPGPTGGYPLSMAYHAGIQPSEEASWVGLGWSLNAGAINRSVNGIPDDQKDATVFNSFRWDGGIQKTFRVGLTAGVAGIGGPSIGYTAGNDTYKGFGYGVDVGISISGALKSGFGGSSSLGVGISPWGSGYHSAGLSLSGKVGSVQSKIGLSTNFKESSGYISTLRGNLGANINSGGASLLFNHNTIVSTSFNSKATRLSSSSQSWSFPTPIISLSSNYKRYWINQVDEAFVFGTLHNSHSGHDYDTDGFDSYTLYNDFWGLINEEDPDRGDGMSFPAYDNYQVLGQGVRGNIRPHHFTIQTKRQNKIVDNNSDNQRNMRVRNLDLAGETSQLKKAKFRFVGEFSNHYLQSGGALNQQLSHDQDVDFTMPSAQHGLISNNHLAGSKHVEWYSNAEIDLGTAYADGLVKPDVQGFDFEVRPSDQIGAYKVTNESGVTYHYALPVYNLKEVTYTQKRDDANVKSHTTIGKSKPYAYTWLLTAITGPDYVDRNFDNKVNEGDWGYWVDFNYGKWTDAYHWRNPEIGFRTDLDENFQNCSVGTKEVYYLDAVKTATHTALFYKSIRADGKSVNRNTLFVNSGQLYKKEESIVNVPSDPNDTDTEVSIDWAIPVPSLKLDKIILVENDELNTDFATLKATSGEIGINSFEINNKMSLTSVLDAQDDLSLTNVIRTIDMGYNYELSPETINSFDPNGNLYADINYNSDTAPTIGKLTLKSLTFGGKDGVSLIPPNTFQYELGTVVEESVSIERDSDVDQNIYNIDLNSGFASKLKSGDIIRTNGESYFFLAEQIPNNDGANRYRGYYIGPEENLVGNSGAQYYSGVVRTTKNPPHHTDAYDSWGYFKGDYDQYIADRNESLGRLTSKFSSEAKDVWSLRRINNSLGSYTEIQYESDDYSQSILNNNYSLRLKSIEDNGGGAFTIAFWEGEESGIKQGDQLKGAFSFRATVENLGTEEGNATVTGPIQPVDLVVSSVGSDGSLTVQSSELSSWLADETDLGDGEPYLVDKTVISGVLSFAGNRFGDGLRVASVSVGGGDEYITTKYEYAQQSGISSGITPFEPFSLGDIVLVENEVLTSGNDLSVKQALYDQYEQVMNYSRELPAPAVTYGQVMVSSEIKHDESASVQAPGYIVYEFETFSKDQIFVEGHDSQGTDLVPGDLIIEDGASYTGGKRYDRTLHSMPGKAGILKATANYGANDAKLSETKHFYLHNQLMADNGSNTLTRINQYEQLLNGFSNQGQIEETAFDARVVLKEGGDFNTVNDDEFRLVLNTARRHTYPVVSLGSKTIDYQNGITAGSYNLSFDQLTGLPTELLSVDEEGRNSYQKMVPAYQQYSDLNHILDGGKNMLSQPFASYIYQVDPVSDPLDVDPSSLSKTGLIGASVQLWTNSTPVLGVVDNFQQGIWRKGESISFIGKSSDEMTNDGLYSLTDFNENQVDWLSYSDGGNQAGQTPTGWQKSAKPTLFDVNSHVLEAKDINGIFAATKFDVKNEKVYSTASNVRYNAYAFSGAEDVPVNSLFGGDVSLEDGVITTTSPHTGLSALTVNAGQDGFSFEATEVEAGATYIVTCWTNNPVQTKIRYQIDGVIQAETSADIKTMGSVNDWHQVRAKIKLPSNLTNATFFIQAGSQSIRIDDFMVKPVNSGFTGFVYNQWGELSDVINSNNLPTHYEYDDMGRLKSVWIESFQYGKKQVSENSIKYINQN